MLLDNPFERAGAIDRIITRVREPNLCLLVDFEHDLSLRKQTLQILELNVDDPLHLLATEPVEQNDFIEAVDELWSERAAHRLHDLFACGLGGVGVPQGSTKFSPPILG